MSYKQARELVYNYEQKTVARVGVQYDELLSSISPSVRQQGIQGLIKYNLQSEKVDTLLEDPHQGVRKAAVKYFRENGVGEDYKKIVPLLTDPEESVKEETIQTIYWLTTEFDLRPLLRDKSPKVRLATLTVLQEEIEEEHLDPLLNDLNPDVSRLAKKIKIHRTSDVEYLRSVVNGDDKAALKKLALIRLIPLESKYVYEKLREFLQDKTQFNDRERKSFTAVVKDLPLEIAEKVVNEQVEEIQDEVLLPKFLVPYAKINEESPSRAISAIEKCFTSKDSKVREFSVKALGKLGEPTTADALREMVNDEEERVRAAAVDALSKMLDYNLTERIAELLEDHSKYVRKSAVKAIGKLKMEDYFSAVVEIIKNTKEDDSLRKEALKISGRLKIEDAVMVIRGILNNDAEDFEMKSLAARTLLRISPEAVIDFLQ